MMLKLKKNYEQNIRLNETHAMGYSKQVFNNSKSDKAVGRA